MIGRLRGEVVDRETAIDGSAAEILLEVGGVGYRLTVTGSTMAGLPPAGEVVLHVHHHFWEADQKLFGFASKDERMAFEGLLAAHKVGPALALAILSVHPPADLARVLADDDLDALCEVPGVGKKTAQRLLVELKSSLVLPAIDGQRPAAAPNGAVPVADGPLGDVRAALAELGYSGEEIRAAIAAVRAEADDGADAGALLRSALRSLAGA